MKQVVLFSGGIDSYITWLKVGKPNAIYADMGHKYAVPEMVQVRKLIPTAQIISMPFLGQFEKPDAEIPMRNLYLAMLAANMGYDHIWLTVQKDELSIPDRSPEFFNQASALLSTLTGRDVKVSTPWWYVDKVGMIKWYLDEGYSIDDLKSTWACYYPSTDANQEPCANCGACFRRAVAMSLNGVHEDWHDRCFNNPITQVYYDRALNQSSDKSTGNSYGQDRTNHILSAVENHKARSNALVGA